jgi:exonuclease SbcC
LLQDCRKESLKGLKEVQNILSWELDIEQERGELEKYRANLNAALQRQKLLSKKMGKKEYDATRHQQLNRELEALKIDLKQLNHQLSSKQLTREQYQARLKKKDALMQEFKDISIRKDNIQEICNLLRGNGFINFISSVYLQNLCKAANVRFTRLTGNRLSLELNRQNEFMVRDHLNDGKLRLLKTLSGGQIFQASLSLALSLAENVKNLNQADQSFFFLDEGFGSLDRVSLQLVFESLKLLQKENRIVGIISHVEDLQLEIDTYLKVTQDTRDGSIIRYSWE